MLRTLPGVTMTVTLPLQCFLGVAIHRQAPTDSQPGSAAVVLEHADPQLSVTLNHVSEVRDPAWEWRSWAKTLGLPPLVRKSTEVCVSCCRAAAEFRPADLHRAGAASAC